MLVLAVVEEQYALVPNLLPPPLIRSYRGIPARAECLRQFQRLPRSVKQQRRHCCQGSKVREVALDHNTGDQLYPLLQPNYVVCLCTSTSSSFVELLVLCKRLRFLREQHAVRPLRRGTGE